MKKKNSPLVGIIMGSDSDLPTMQGALDCLRDFNVNFEIQIVSAHRTPKKMLSYAQNAEKRGLKIIIAGAGGAAHLPGMVAAVTTLPVVGVPVSITKLDGLDALLSIVQMPKGVPVACVAIDNSYNAGLLAIKILSLHNKNLLNKLLLFQSSQAKKVQIANRRLKSKRSSSL